MPTSTDDIIPSRPPMRTVARPVANLGNTCYINAVLQALAHAPELMRAMDCQSHRAVCPIALEKEAKEKERSSSSTDRTEEIETQASKKVSAAAATRKSQRNSGRKSPPDQQDDSSDSEHKFCALCEVEEHFKSVHDSQSPDTPVAPSTFVDGFIRHVAPWFRLGIQEDSHEFLRLLIDSMQKSCLHARKTTCPEKNTAATTSSNSPAPPNAPSPDDDDTEYPFSLFRGAVESNVTCQRCHTASITLDPIEDVGLEVTLPNVPVPDTSRASSRNTSPTPPPALADVQTAFQRFINVEQLETYTCEKCNEPGRATKQTRLASIPPILTLHLKRFRYGEQNTERTTRSRPGGRSELSLLLGSSHGRSGASKIEGHIKFDLAFDLRPFLTEDLQNKYKNFMCRLFAVVVHAGKNSHSGHYISYVRDITKNEWWKMDDRRVESTTVDEVLRAEAYMLFYRVLQHPISLSLEAQCKTLNGTLMGSSSNGVKNENTEIETHRRKRCASEVFKNGHEWAKSRSRLPSHLSGLISKAEEMVADEIHWTSDMYSAINEEASARGAAVGRGPTRVQPSESDVVSGFSRARKLLTDIFYRITRHYDGDSSVCLFPPDDDDDKDDENQTTEIPTRREDDLLLK